jgi:hypothetical protein
MPLVFVSVMGNTMQTPTQETVATRLRTFKGALPEPVKALVRGTTRAAGVLTSSARVLPDFLVIGTKRGGTTSLWFALAGHPDVAPLFPALQELKSPHYFDIHYDKPLGWYRSFFATRAQLRRHEARTGRRAFTGEASPYYMFHPLAAERIAKVLPEVKLVVSLRDPVERLWSHYNERLAGHTETLGVEQAVDAEAGRLAGEVERIVAEQPGYYSFHHDLSSYLARGRYLEHLQPYLDRFGPDQLLVLRAEDYYSDPVGELAKVSAHIGLAPFEDRGSPEHYNKLPRSSMPDALRARLVEYYRPHVDALQSALDRDFRWKNFRP